MFESLEFIQTAVARQRNKPFLKATMAASAMAMLADGEIQLSERYRLDEILERLEGLKIYDPQKAIAILDEYIHDLRSNEREAREILLGKLARAGQDPESAGVIPNVVLAICASDGVFSEGEKHVFEEICAALGVNAADYPDPVLETSTRASQSD